MSDLLFQEMHSRQQKELKEKLRILSSKVRERKNQSQERAQNRCQKAQNGYSAVELQMLLNISRSETDEARSELRARSEQLCRLEDRVFALEESKKNLEKTNFSLTQLLAENDLILNQCIPDFLNKIPCTSSTPNIPTQNSSPEPSECKECQNLQLLLSQTQDELQSKLETNLQKEEVIHSLNDTVQDLQTKLDKNERDTETKKICQLENNQVKSDLVKAKTELKQVQIDMENALIDNKNKQTHIEYLEANVTEFENELSRALEQLIEQNKLNDQIQKLKDNLEAQKDACSKLEIHNSLLQKENKLLTQNKSHLDIYETRIKKFHKEPASAKLFSSKNRMLDSLAEKKEMLDLLISVPPRSPDLTRNRQDLEEEFQSLEVSFGSTKDMFETTSRNSFDGRRIESIQHENDRLREELAKAHNQIKELTERFTQIDKRVNASDALAFLQCEAAALEDILLPSEYTEDLDHLL